MDATFREIVIEIGSSVFRMSPVGNPEIWAANVAHRQANNRAAGGQLGVRALGGGSSGGTVIKVDVHVAGDGSASSSTDTPGYESFGKDLASFVELKYQQMMKKDLGQGGRIRTAIKNGGHPPEYA